MGDFKELERLVQGNAPEDAKRADLTLTGQGEVSPLGAKLPSGERSHGISPPSNGQDTLNQPSPPATKGEEGASPGEADPTLDTREVNAEPRSPDNAGGKQMVFNPQHISVLLQEVPEEIEWLWERMLPVGTLGVLVSFMKVGKSTLAYDLALSVSQGEPFLGYSTKKTGVLILSLEERRQDAVNRLRSYGATGEEPIWILTENLLMAKSQNFYDGLRQFITSHHIGFVLVDSLSRFALFKDENDNSEVTKFLSPLLDLAHTTDTVILLLHHEPKGGGLSGRNIRGAGAIFANVDVAITLSKPEGNVTDRTLEILGRYQDHAPDKLRLRFEDGRYISLGAEEDQTFNARKERVFVALDETWRDVKEIAEATLIPPSTVRLALDGLEKGGLAKKQGSGVKGDPFKYRRATPEQETGQNPASPPGA